LETCPALPLAALLDGGVAYPYPMAGARAFARDAAIDLLKVDVEGMELEVLRGLAPAHWRRVRAVTAEAHDVGKRMADIAAYLTDAAGPAFAPANVHMCATDVGQPAALNNRHVYAHR
jgi:hypothetical protein